MVDEVVVEETEEQKAQREEEQQRLADEAEAKRLDDEKRDALPVASLQTLPVDGTVAFRADRDEAVDVERSWPSWRYGPDGQSAIFNNEAEVPDGWTDHPAKVTDSNWKSGDPLPGDDTKVGESTDADGNRHLETPPSLNPTTVRFEDMDKDEIVSSLRAKFIEHNPKWSKAKLIELLSRPGV